MSAEEISSWVDEMGRESAAIKKEAITISWYMRGGITYDDVMQLSQEERSIINDLINSNLETTKKSGLPFF